MGQPETAEEQCARRSLDAPDLNDWVACMRELSLHILDAVENSINAGATRIELTIEEDLKADRLHITIRDNGRGMSPEEVERAVDPFYTTRKTRRVGLGLPLFKAAAERCNGGLEIASEVGRGTTLRATFQHSHLDRAPLGDMPTTLLTIILFDAADLRYLHRVDGREFSFDTAEIRATLGGVPLTHPEVRQWLEAFIAAGEKGLNVATF